MSKTWCALPWTHLCVRTDNTLKPCCRFLSNNPSNEFVVSLDSLYSNGIEAMEDPLFLDIRKKMLNNEIVPGCQKCYSQESDQKTKRKSMRQYYNEVLGLDQSRCTEKFDKVRYIEMSIDNICNLQCKMCDSKFSSKLQNRDKFLEKTVHKKLEPNFTKLDNVDLSELTRLKILGGEPFITPNFEKFIDYLFSKTDPSKITIDIATNGTTLPNKKLIKKLNRLKSLYINVSLDAYDVSNDYQRYGSNYLTTTKNAKLYETLIENSSVSFHVTTSVYTANSLSKTINYFESNNLFYSVDFVRDPFYLSLLHTPELYVKWVIEENKDNKVAVRLIKNFLKEHKFNEDLWNQFLETTKRLDKYYKIDLKNYNIDLFNFLENNYQFGKNND